MGRPLSSMEESPNTWTIISEFFKYAIPAIIGYLVWVHKTVTRIDKELAINQTKDDAVIEKLNHLDERVLNIGADITEIKIELARQKNNEKIN